MVDLVTLNLPSRICLHKDFHARHEQPPSGAEAKPCPGLDPHRQDTLTGHGERPDNHLRRPYPWQNSAVAVTFGVKKLKTHHVVDALGDEFALTALGILPVFVGGVNDQVSLFKVGM